MPRVELTNRDRPWTFSSASSRESAGKLREHFLQGGYAALVLVGGADGNADPFSQAVTRHGPDNNAAASQLVEDDIGLAHARHHKVRGRRDKLEGELAQGVLEKDQSGGVIGAGAGPVFLIFDSGDGR